MEEVVPYCCADGGCNCTKYENNNPDPMSRSKQPCCHCNHPFGDHNEPKLFRVRFGLSPRVMSGMLHYEIQKQYPHLHHLGTGKAKPKAKNMKTMLKPFFESMMAHNVWHVIIPSRKGGDWHLKLIPAVTKHEEEEE
jgi:hypothetical protein